MASPVAAQDATWTGANSASYDDPLNWDTGSVPSSTGTAFFGTSTVSTIAIHHPQVVGGWTFNAGASNYANPTFPVNPATDSVAFNGAGIVINGGSLLLTALSLQFNNNSSAGSATLTRNGISNFFDNSTAASANITLQQSGLNFRNTSTAANSTITVNAGGVLTFQESSTAGSATITNSSQISFSGSSTAGAAHLINLAGGTIDLSGLTSSGMSAGSIEGVGSIVLGAKNLTVGGNNLPTTFSGALSGIGGSLSKEGAGVLTLSGVNTYTGGTTVNGGTILLSAAGRLGAATGSTTVTAGTLDLGGTTQTQAAVNLGGAR